jgi:hypothetical protein
VIKTLLPEQNASVYKGDTHMKYVKMLGLAALAAMAVMAVGAASASASAKVCSTTSVGGVACKAGHGTVYKGKIVAKVNATGAVLTATNPDNTTVKCTESTAEGEITNGETGTGKITKLTFGTCSSSFCFGTMTATSPAGWPATATTTIPGTENTNGIMDVTINGFAGKFSCTFPETVCEYSAAVPQLHVTGSDNAPVITATNIKLTKIAGPEFTCGKEGDWSGTYNVSTPSSLFIE